MGIFGWDLPPGCTQRHIDEAFGGDPAAEAFADSFIDKVDEIFGKGYHDAVENEFEKLSVWIWHKFGEAYARGYQQSSADSALAKDPDEDYRCDEH